MAQALGAGRFVNALLFNLVVADATVVGQFENPNRKMAPHLSMPCHRKVFTIS